MTILSVAKVKVKHALNDNNVNIEPVNDRTYTKFTSFITKMIILSCKQVLKWRLAIVIK